MSSMSQLKESILAFMKKNEGTHYEVKEISEGMNMNGFADFKKLVNGLAVLEREGRIFLNKQGKFKLTKEKPVLTGKFRANDRGFGFVEIEGEDHDVFIPPHQTNYAMEADIVSIEITKEAGPKSDRGPEGKVKAVLEHGVTQMVGEFFAYDDQGVDETGFYGYMEPRDKKNSGSRVFIESHGIRPTEGSIVLVELTEYPTADSPKGLQGLVKSVLGYKDDPGIDILSIVYKHGIPSEFPEEVIEEANQLPDRVLPEEIEGRTDLRDEMIVTIDGEGTKDFDDAIQVKVLENGNYQLGVHIADVAHYVKDNSAIDQEAFNRATSVYLLDRVIPMLPQVLSNGICSLNPNVDRLTLSCVMEFDRSGKRVDYDIFPSVISSKERMTYTAVNQMLMEKDETVRQEYAHVLPMIEAMGDLHAILEKKRKQRGSIDFDTKEAQIVMDEEGKTTDILVVERGVGERLIESFMLSANETVSEHYTRKNLPILYRVHQQPDPQRMQTFMDFVTGFGIKMKGSNETVSPKALQAVLKKVKGEPEEIVISMLMLRSMMQAKYDVEPQGHFGLAAEFYSHFTSPIRRYPDLILHRLIHAYAQSETRRNEKRKWSERLPEIAEHSSIAERRAVDAERETNDMKKAEFMEDKVGEEYEGIIVSTTGFGLFIQLPNTVEGLVHISKMDTDYFEFDEKNMMLIGQRTGLIYRVGQKINVRVTHASAEMREVDFEIIPDPDAPKIDPPKKSRSRSGGSRKNNQKTNGNKRNFSNDKGKPAPKFKRRDRKRSEKSNGNKQQSKNKNRR